MKPSQFSRITDELLSAYLDDDLSHQERELVEAAVAADDQVAWRLESLRQTVRLLSNLPDIAPSRSFMLDESMVGDITTARRQAAARRRAQAPATVPALATPHQNTLPATRGNAAPSTTAHSGDASSSLGQRFRAGWHAFWHGGNPLLRNLATVSLVLTIFVAGADTLLTQPASPASPRAVLMQQEPQAASAPASEAAAMPELAVDSVADAEIAAADMTGDAATEQNADAAAMMRSIPADDAPPAPEEGEETEEPGAIAAMSAPALATPALVDGATGDAEAGDPTLELAPIEETTIAEAAGEEDAVALDEGGFGDADIAAPLILQGEATGMGGGGDGTPGDGMGSGGGGGDEPGPRGGGRDSGGDGTTSSEFVPTTPDPSAAFATGMLTESATEESLVESTPEARMATADDAGSVEDADQADADEAQEAESSTLAATSLPPAESTADQDKDTPVEEVPVEEATPSERVAILSAPPAAATEPATSAVSAPAPTGQESEQPVPTTLPTNQLGRVLTWIQWGLMVVAATFGLLWWRSRP